MRSLLIVIISFCSFLTFAIDNSNDSIFNNQRTLLSYVSIDTLFIQVIKTGQIEIVKISDGSIRYSESWISSLKWNTDRDEIWGILESPGTIEYFFKYDYKLKKLDKYKAPEDCQSEFDINPNLDELLYSDYSLIIDTESAEDLIKSKTKIHLYIFDFKTYNKTLIRTIEGKEFRPRWITNEIIEINSNTGENREKLKYKK
jgi:hypothetical protein